MPSTAPHPFLFSPEVQVVNKSWICYLSGILQIIEYGYFQGKFFTSDNRVGEIQENEKWLEGL
jgi:hypothetical protein